MRFEFVSDFELRVSDLPIGLTAVLTATSFPRGPGFYLNPYSLALVVLVYLVWLRLCAWVDRDARQLEINHLAWNSLLFAGGVLGLLVFWLVPWFAIAFAFLLASCITPYALYVRMRNELVPERERVFTDRHMRMVVQRLTRINMHVPDELDAEPEPDVRFLPKEGEESDAPRLFQAARQRGRGLVADLLTEAITRHADALEFEMREDQFHLQLRIDGIRHPFGTLSRPRGGQAIALLKLLAGLDAAEHHLPQAGVFPLEVESIRWEVRLRTSGMAGGEHLTLDFARPNEPPPTLAQLGVREPLRDMLVRACDQSAGLFLVCGPEDAERATTVYALLADSLGRHKRILTVEHHIECKLKEVEQVEAGGHAGDSLAAALRRFASGRAIDTLFVGNTSDEETAELVYQHALNGKFVFTTVAGRDSILGLFQLVHLGILSNELAKVLTGVLAQRLVRVLCPQCKVKYRPDPELVRKANLPVEKITFFFRPPEASERPVDSAGQPIVCPHCNGTGYRGRTGIFEYLPITDRIRRLLEETASFNEVRQEALQAGVGHLQDEALRLVIDGVTSIAEMIRVLK